MQFTYNNAEVISIGHYYILTLASIILQYKPFIHR